MIWLYRLQQRLSITRNEALAVLTLTGLFLAGLTVQHVREQRAPPLAVDSLAASGPARAAAVDTSTAPPRPSPRRPVPINEASARRLKMLDGIGPALSKRIIEYRSTERPFQRPAELKRVRGIGPKTLAELRPVITVSGARD